MGFDACFGKLKTEERVNFELGEYAASLLPRINPHPARLLGRWRVSKGGTKAVSSTLIFSFSFHGNNQYFSISF